MYKEINVSVSPIVANDSDMLDKLVSSESENGYDNYRIIKRSIDARKKDIKVNLRIGIWKDQEMDQVIKTKEYQDVSNGKEVVVIGAGPAGLFAALRLIEKGLKPIIYERGKSVEERTEDISNIHNKDVVNPDSNYGFGEGGAGTFSDGKLFTRSKKKGSVVDVLETLVAHGASEDILVDAHPHVGTNNLVKIVRAIRETILRSGGEINFNSRVESMTIIDDSIVDITLQDGSVKEVSSVILATGHSARDTYSMLREIGVKLEFKSFAVGVRLEHPQTLINNIQYHNSPMIKHLPPAKYNFVKQVNGRGVYSFCMCPGGTVVPAATAPGQIVVNGMSSSSRGGAFANSGIVVEVRQEDLIEIYGDDTFAGIKFQEDLEKDAFESADNTQNAPAQRMIDFVNGVESETLNASSYKPGLTSSPMHRWLPPFIADRLQEAFFLFGRAARGFLTNDATVIGVETRTSSPLRIERDRMNMNSVNVKNLYPAGEGAGYSGGIVSSAIDGQLSAEAIFKKI